MRVLVTGVHGQLGYDLMHELRKRGYTAIGSDLPDAAPEADMQYVPMDITDSMQVEAVLTKWKPEALMHCAAWTAVDAAEENEAACRRVNGEGTANIARVCHSIGAKMLYLSTDYVFDGQGTEARKPDCTRYQPLNIYGQTKLEGEQAVAAALTRFFIVRISWVFGIHGNNFVKAMLKLGKTHDTLRVVCDQIGSPTYTFDLARLLVDMIETERYGYYHATNGGDFISWYDFACEIFRQAGYPTRVLPVTTAEYGASKAKRPMNSRLDSSKLQAQGFAPLPHWQDALKRYLKEFP